MRTARGAKRIAVLLAFASCYADPLTPVPGPEKPELLGDLHGSMLAYGEFLAKDELDLYLLGRGVHRTIELDHDMESFSGLDERGRFVYERRNVSLFAAARDELFLASIDGSAERRIYSTLGWIQPWPALSQSGKVAFLESGTEDGPRLCVLDLASRESRFVPMRVRQVLDLAWLDGERALVHASWMLRNEVPDELRPLVPPPKSRWPDETVTIVFVLDLDTGVDRPLCVGKQPRPIAGGSTIAVANQETGVVFVIDAKDGRRIRETTPIPGWDRECFTTRLVAALDSDHVVYVGRPTAGAEQRSYIPGNPLFRDMMRTVKVADLSNGSFATLVPYVRRPMVQYAPWEPSVP